MCDSECKSAEFSKEYNNVIISLFFKSKLNLPQGVREMKSGKENYNAKRVENDKTS